MLILLVAQYLIIAIILVWNVMQYFILKTEDGGL